MFSSPRPRVNPLLFATESTEVTLIKSFAGVQGGGFSKEPPGRRRLHKIPDPHFGNRMDIKTKKEKT
jgi:hypothetical protein